jgi:protein-S-isoprenylcysteine O-methyltransferase Ste14
MKASALEFRFRFLVHGIIFVIGFTAPWNLVLHYDTIRTWQLLAATMNRRGWMGFSGATIAVLAGGIFFATLAALLRTWAAAYLDSSVVQAAGLHGDVMVAAGPYRYLRNPLYVGIFLHTLALSLLMPPTGAAFSIVAVGLFQLRLIGAEEDFLTRKLGESYVAYRATVPSLLPSWSAKAANSSAQPRWTQAVAGEIYMWGVALSFAVLGWRYNGQLVTQGVLVSLGVSLVVRAFLLKNKLPKK